MVQSQVWLEQPQTFDQLHAVFGDTPLRSLVTPCHVCCGTASCCHRRPVLHQTSGKASFDWLYTVLGAAVGSRPPGGTLSFIFIRCCPSFVFLACRVGFDEAEDSPRAVGVERQIYSLPSGCFGLGLSYSCDTLTNPGFEEADTVPKLFVLMGNFQSDMGAATAAGFAGIRENFNALAALLRNFHRIRVRPCVCCKFTLYHLFVVLVLVFKYTHCVQAQRMRLGALQPSA